MLFSEAGMDSDGNPTSDIKSLTVAYTVTVVRYVALIGLHVRTIGVCIAVRAMTTENCVEEKPGTLSF